MYNGCHMVNENPESAFPNQIAVGTDRADVTYIRLAGHFAVHGTLPAALTASRIGLLGEESVSICRGAWPRPDQLAPGTIVTPVYAPGGVGPPAVPTGLVFIRFTDRVTVESRRARIEQAGYVISQTLSYAPQAAWLRAASGSMADALTNLDRLATLDDIAAVTPQLIAHAARR